MTNTPGSSSLTAEQTDWYRGRFGEAYVRVQDQPARLPRRLRRRQLRKLSSSDFALYEMFQRRGAASEHRDRCCP